MTWERARSDQQIEFRIQEIVAATAGLYQSQRYEEITLAMIGKAAKFTRSNLYRYFNNKEDIFLQLLQQDISQWQNDLVHAIASEYHTAAAAAEIWVAILLKHQRMINLFTILYTLIEPHATQACLNGFKQHTLQAMLVVGQHLQRFFPFQTAEQAQAFLMAQTSLAIGLYPLLNLSDKQIIAMQHVEMPCEPGHYLGLLLQSTESLIQGLI